MWIFYEIKDRHKLFFTIKTTYWGNLSSRNVQKHRKVSSNKIVCRTKVSQFLRDRENDACIFSRREIKFAELRSSHLEVFLIKGFLKICSKFTGEHLCGSAILIKLLWIFIEIALRHGCSPVNLLHIFGKSFPRNTFGWLLLRVVMRR